MHPNIVLLKLNVYLKVLKVWFRLKITPPHRPVWNLDKVNRKETRRWAIDSFSPNLALIPAYTHHTIQQLYKYALLGSLSRISIPAIIPNSFFSKLHSPEIRGSTNNFRPVCLWVVGFGMETQNWSSLGGGIEPVWRRVELEPVDSLLKRRHVEINVHLMNWKVKGCVFFFGSILEVWCFATREFLQTFNSFMPGSDFETAHCSPSQQPAELLRFPHWLINLRDFPNEEVVCVV